MNVTRSNELVNERELRDPERIEFGLFVGLSTLVRLPKYRVQRILGISEPAVHSLGIPTSR